MYPRRHETHTAPNVLPLDTQLRLIFMMTAHDLALRASNTDPEDAHPRKTILVVLMSGRKQYNNLWVILGTKQVQNLVCYPEGLATPPPYP